MDTMEQAHFFTMLSLAAEANGCRLIDIDFEKQKIQLDGPSDKKEECALALLELFG